MEKVLQCRFLTKLLNNIFACGYFSSTWSDGLILPLHKNGSVDNVENNRGITLLVKISKLLRC